MKNIARFAAFSFLIILWGCGEKYDDEITKISKCRTAAQMLGGDYLKKMTPAFEWKAVKIKQVEFDPDRLKYLMKITSKLADKDGNPDKEKVLEWYDDKYCASMLEDYNSFIGKNK